MPASQQYIDSHTAMGANLIGTGATFRVWAPNASDVYVCGTLNATNQWALAETRRLVKDTQGYWSGFVDGIRDGDEYKFHVTGSGSAGLKRDPYARELTTTPAYPRCNCVVRDPTSYPWHDTGFQPPAFNDLMIYQFHIGTFSGPRRDRRPATFLDVIDRIEYLVALGVNAVEPLPIVEFASPRSMGYEGSDIYSPEMDYCVEPGAPELAQYLLRVNALLKKKGLSELPAAALSSHVGQFKAFVDLCHVYGLAVILDVVYNHAGGAIEGQDESLWFFDRQTDQDRNRSLYFTDRTYTGPVFAVWKQEVRQFLIDNAGFFVTECRADGLRYDQVSAIVSENTNDGWRFCQDATRTVRTQRSNAIQVAEFWDVNQAVVRPVESGGAGFDATWHDGLRESIRAALRAAQQGRNAFVSMDGIAEHLYPSGFDQSWRAVQCVESHDEVYTGREPRIAAFGYGWSWYARSRARVATALLLTAPGIPMLFMGQEFFENKQWSDNPGAQPDTLIWWEGLEGGQKVMADHLRFTQEAVWLRRRYPALRGQLINVYHCHNDNRVLAFHRWLPEGRDVVVVASLNEATWYDYALGFPMGGDWKEVFNSDVYDGWVNPQTSGNGGRISADGPGLHGLPASAGIVIPANGVLVFARDDGNLP